MDPISIIGLAASISGLVDITTRSILALVDLQGKYSDLEFKIGQIAGQLSTVRTALKRIKDLVEFTHEGQSQKNETQIAAWNDDQLVDDFITL